MNKPEIFKAITVGGMNKELLLERLLKAGIQFNNYAHMLFEHDLFLSPPDSKRLSLVKLSQSDLGLNHSSNFEQITNKALGLGLGLCPIYLGAFLRLEYLDQQTGPYLTIASKKPESDEAYPNGFYIRNLESALWLRGYRASDDYEWPMDHEFIFLYDHL